MCEESFLSHNGNALKPLAALLGRQAFTALCTTTVKNLTAVFCGHAATKAVTTGAN